MGRLIVLILVAALIWMSWWFIGSTITERSLRAWVDERRSVGWVADYSALNVRGFPNRFDTTINDVVLADPTTGIAWSAPFFQLLMLSYKPNHVIVALPNDHRFSTPLQNLEMTSDRARGSIVFRPNTALTLDRLTFVLDEFDIQSSLGWQVRLREARISTEPVSAREDAHRIGAEILKLSPSDATRAVLDPAGILPTTVDLLRLDASVGFDAPWDRHAIEDARPQITDIDLRDLRASWGDVDFRAAGKLTVDQRGLPTGRITVKAVQWRRLLDMAISAGLVAQSLAPTFERAFELMASLSGTPDTLDAPLTFQNGFVSFGPIPLGPFPPLTIR